VNLGNWFADNLVHEIVDDQDDHRRLVSKCGQVFSYIHPKHRKGIDETVVTCFQCLTLEEAQEPEWQRQYQQRPVPLLPQLEYWCGCGWSGLLPYPQPTDTAVCPRCDCRTAVPVEGAVVQGGLSHAIKESERTRK
jgi:hypothetical protein